MAEKRRAQARYLGHQTLNRFFLHNLEEERKVGDVEAARTSFNAGGGGFRECSGSENNSNSGGEGRGSSSKRQIWHRKLQ
jgi:hypothetical protein